MKRRGDKKVKPLVSAREHPDEGLSDETKLHLLSPPSPGEEALCRGGEYPPLIAKKPIEVSATCTGVTTFYAYGRENLKLTFVVFEPSKHEGVKLFCFAPIRPRWKKSRIPIGAKLGKMIVVATGKRRIRGQSKSSLKRIFVGKAYRCRIRPTEQDVPYSVVDMILDVLAG